MVSYGLNVNVFCLFNARSNKGQKYKIYRIRDITPTLQR